jgi:hypothetical protein
MKDLGKTKQICDFLHTNPCKKTYNNNHHVTELQMRGVSAVCSICLTGSTCIKWKPDEFVTIPFYACSTVLLRTEVIKVYF